jgi:hypothetical protein
LNFLPEYCAADAETENNARVMMIKYFMSVL